MVGLSAEMTVKLLAILLSFYRSENMTTKKNVKVISRKGRLSIILAECDGKLYLATPGLDSSKLGLENECANANFYDHFSEDDFGQRRIYATDSFTVVGSFDSFEAAIDYISSQSLDNDLANNDIIATRQSEKYFTDKKIDSIDWTFTEASDIIDALKAISSVANDLSIKISAMKEAVRASANSKNNKTTESNLVKLDSALDFVSKNDIFSTLVKLGGGYVKSADKFDASKAFESLLPAKK